MKIQNAFLIVFSVFFFKSTYVQAIGHRFFIRLFFYKKTWRQLVNDEALFVAIIDKIAVHQHLRSLHRLTEKHYDYWPPTFSRLILHNEIPVQYSNLSPI